MLQLTVHPRLSSHLFYHIKLFYIHFFWYFKPLVTPLFIQFICNVFTFSVLFSFWNKLDKYSIFTYLLHGQILQELLQFKHWNFLKNIQWVAIISHKFIIITQINVSYSTCSQSLHFMTLNAFKQLRINWKSKNYTIFIRSAPFLRAYVYFVVK